jgi:hypothetical protein
MDRGKRMPTRRLSNPGVIQILSLHIPVLNSASDHFLVQQARIDTNSLPSQSPFSSLLFPLRLFFLSLSTTDGLSVLTGIVIMSDSM